MTAFSKKLNNNPKKERRLKQFAFFFACKGEKMKIYIYPQNLKATANIWLWSLKDFAVIAVMLLISVVSLAKIHFVIPLVITVCYAFLTISYGDITVLDYIKYAFKYFVSSQQYYQWQEKRRFD